MSETSLEISRADIPQQLRRVSAEDFMPVFSVQQAIERKKMVNQFINEVLREGENADYGKLVNGARDTKILFKAGAEKLCSIFGLSVTYTEDKIIEDWTGAEHGGEPLFYYSYRCQLSRGGAFIGEAIGSCNSWESKYRYRWVSEEVAKQRADFDSLLKRGGVTTKFEPDFALEKKETGGKYGKPAEYWQAFEDARAAKTARRVIARKMGNREFDGWEITLSQIQFRVPNPEMADVINTCQKMAQKRSLVAAVLVVTNCSDAFTQDVEDFADADQHTATQRDHTANGNSAGESPDGPNPDSGARAPVKSATPNKEKPPERQESLGLSRPVPEALVTRFEALDMDGKQIAPAFLSLEKALIDKGGANGVKAYADTVQRFRDRIPKGRESKTDIKECLLDLWDELQTVVHPLGDLVEHS